MLSQLFTFFFRLESMLVNVGLAVTKHKSARCLIIPKLPRQCAYSHFEFT